MTSNSTAAPQIDCDILVSVLIETASSKVKHNQINETLLVQLKLVGENGEQQVDLGHLNLANIREVYAATTNGNGYFFDFFTRIRDIGKLKELILCRSELLNDESDFINEIRVKNPYRNDFQIFPVEQFARKAQRNLVLRANLKPGEKGTHYVVTTHTGLRQVGSQRASSKPPEVGVQLVGEKGKTKLIPLQNSQLNKQHAFLAGRKDVFDVLATDVGRILKVIVINYTEINSQPDSNNNNNNNSCNWFVDSLEVKSLNNLSPNNNHYIFQVNKNIKPNEEIVLEPMTNGEIDYQVLLRTIDFERPQRRHKFALNPSAYHQTSLTSSSSAQGGGGGVGGAAGAGTAAAAVSTTGGATTGTATNTANPAASGGSGAAGAGTPVLGGASGALASSVSSSLHGHHHHHHGGHQPQRHLIDVYFIITGEHGSTKKIYMNNYEIKRLNEHDDPKEKYFEFKSEDVGKLTKINVSINQDDDPAAYLYIDFIEIKIPSKSEAYKFPVERVLGEFYEDGKCDLDLIVWKHPERPTHIDYEILTEINDETEKETMGRLYLIMHGDQGRTGKIVLNDGNYDNNSIDNYEFAAPDVGKLTKIELFFYPTESDGTWQLESIEVKLKARNEAYKFPVHCLLDTRTNYLELIPWKKPNVIRNKTTS